ncbi:MAG: DUF1840 domain-containing protein [Gammaproteobacteria bacterium]|nr:DUF1840 domain-containing protein [Gammaproteobacteria bacterium]
MLITFQCKSYANITMFGDVAIALIRLMGHSGNVPGAILAEDIPAALTKLEQGLKAAAANEQDTQKPDPDEREVPISLATRAVPLIEMLKAASKDNNLIMWDK